MKILFFNIALCYVSKLVNRQWYNLNNFTCTTTMFPTQEKLIDSVLVTTRCNKETIGFFVVDRLHKVLNVPYDRVSFIIRLVGASTHSYFCNDMESLKRYLEIWTSP